MRRNCASSISRELFGGMRAWLVMRRDVVAKDGVPGGCPGRGSAPGREILRSRDWLRGFSGYTGMVFPGSA